MRRLKSNAIVCFSGGLDSYVMLRKALAECQRVIAFYVEYGSKHATQEVRVSEQIARRLKVPFEKISIPFKVFASGSALIDGQLPLGRDREPQEINPAYVPNRNMVIASLAASLAITRFGFHESDVCMGFHATDGAAFVDTTEQASAALDSCLQACTNGGVSFFSFASITKDNILKYAVDELGVTPVELAQTRSCYQGTESIHCGLCDACFVRHEAFLLAGLDEFSEYAHSY